MLKFAIIGFGGLGQLHFSRYPKVKELACEDIELVALCDIEEKFDKAVATNLAGSGEKQDTSNLRTYLSVDELLDNEELDFVITALPTYIHAEIANKVMNRGINVFSEKPMALTYAQAVSMIETANKNKVKLMIGQCMRYDTMWAKLKEIADSKVYGKVVRGNFDRVSPAATWGWQNWFMDESKSGGAALDFHVHDVDFINYMFGTPSSVTSFASHNKSKFSSIMTRYEYDGMFITSLGDWGNPPSTPFRELFFVQFEKATLETVNGKLMCYPDEGEAHEIECEVRDGYIYEIVDFVDCIVNDKKSEINPPEASLETIRIALAEKESASTNKKVNL